MGERTPFSPHPQPPLRREIRNPFLFVLYCLPECDADVHLGGYNSLYSNYSGALTVHFTHLVDVYGEKDDRTDCHIPVTPQHDPSQIQVPIAQFICANTHQFICELKLPDAIHVLEHPNDNTSCKISIN